MVSNGLMYQLFFCLPLFFPLIFLTLHPRIDLHIFSIPSGSAKTMLFPSSDFESFVHTDKDTSVNIACKKGGGGPPILFLHGYPQTHAMWHLVAPRLLSSYTVVLIDLRGYGASSKPASSEDHAAYSKSAMASDCVAVMQSLGYESFYVCAHDRGARVAHQLCVNYPEKVEKAILLDIVPTKTMYAKSNITFATGYFHWYFLIQPEPLPEDMINAAPKKWLDGCMKRHGAEGLFHEEAYAEYENAMRDPETVRGACEDYRAAATIDIKEQEEDEKNERKIKCPLRILWGRQGMVEKMFDGVKDWKAVHETGDVSGEAVDSGHYIPEQKPDVVLEHIRSFFV